MLSHLKQSFLSDKRQTQEIMPISKEDAFIFDKIIDILTLKNETYLVNLLSNYKKYPDIVVKNLLNHYRENLLKIEQEIIDLNKTEEEGENTTNEFVRRFIEIQEELFEVRYIFSIKKQVEFKPLSTHFSADINNQWEYSLLINEDLTDSKIYANTRIKLATQAELDLEYDLIKNKLKYCQIKFV